MGRGARDVDRVGVGAGAGHDEVLDDGAVGEGAGATGEEGERGWDAVGHGAEVAVLFAWKVLVSTGKVRDMMVWGGWRDAPSWPMTEPMSRISAESPSVASRFCTSARVPSMTSVNVAPRA